MNIQAFDALVDQIREAFVSKAQKLKPWYKTSYKDEKHFVEAAKICEKLEANPNIYIDAQFEGFKNVDHIQAAFLHSTHAEQKYLDYANKNMVKDIPIDYEALYNIQLRYLKNLIKSNLSVEDALLKDYIQFEPWFRILITKNPVPDIIKKYKSKLGKLDPRLLTFLKNKGKFDLRRLT